MERRSWFKKLGLVVLGLVSIGTLGAFSHGRHGDGFMSGARLDKMLDDVSATPDQRGKIHAIHDQLVQKRKALQATRHDDLKALLAQWDAATPDSAAIHAKIDQRAQAMQSFAHDVADALVQVHGILTPDQRAKLSKKWHGRLGE
jgi:Spy/CpxP family protein refolding chaperone